MNTPDRPRPRLVCGLDVGKTFHHAHVLDEDGALVLSRRVDNDHQAIERLYRQIGALGQALVVVDQPRGIGALALALAHEHGFDAACLPPAAMRDFARLLPGTAKTDRIDAAAIARAALTLPEVLRPLAVLDEDEADLKVLLALRGDLVGDKVRLVNRIRALLLEAHCVPSSVSRPVGTAVGILDQDGTGRKPHVQHGAKKGRDRDLHQIRP